MVCMSWRCIQCREAHSASCLGLATATEHEPLARASINQIDVRMEREYHHCTRKLGHRASSEARGSVTVFCHTCLDRPALLVLNQAPPPPCTHKHAQLIKCMQRQRGEEPGSRLQHYSIDIRVEQEHRQPFWPSYAPVQDMRGVPYRSIRICACPYILTVVTVQGTDQKL